MTKCCLKNKEFTLQILTKLNPQSIVIILCLYSFIGWFGSKFYFPGVQLVVTLVHQICIPVFPLICPRQVVHSIVNLLVTNYKLHFNPLRILVHQGNKYFTIHKQSITTSPPSPYKPEISSILLTIVYCILIVYILLYWAKRENQPKAEM